MTGRTLTHQELEELGEIDRVCFELCGCVEAKTDNDPHPFRAYVRCVEEMVHHGRPVILLSWSGDRFWFPTEYLHGDSEVKDPGDSGVLLVKHIWASRNGWW